MLEKEHPLYLETTAYRSIVKFTALQLVLLAIVYGITWAGIAGVVFPGAVSFDDASMTTARFDRSTTRSQDISCTCVSLI